MQRTGKPCAWHPSAALFGALLATTLPLAGQGEEAQARQVLQQSLQAHGGAQALERLGDTLSAGRIRQGLGGPSEAEFDFRIEARGFDRWRTTLQGGDRLTVRSFSGGFGWVTGRSGIRPLTARAAANRINPFNPVLGLLRAELEGELSLEHLGMGELNGRQVHRLSALRLDADSLRLERGRPIDRAYEVAVDAQTLLVAELALASNDWDSRRPEMWERFEYSDYRQAEGLTVPFRILKSRYGAPEEEVALTDFQAASLEEGFPRPEGGS